MSLFPAYVNPIQSDGGNNASVTTEDTGKQEWLTNISFKPVTNHELTGHVDEELLQVTSFEKEEKKIDGKQQSIPSDAKTSEKERKKGHKKRKERKDEDISKREKIESCHKRVRESVSASTEVSSNSFKVSSNISADRDHKSASTETFLDAVKSSKDDFRLDRKPDNDNLTYGSIYRNHIAKYRCRFYIESARQRLQKRAIVERKQRYFNCKNEKHEHSSAVEEMEMKKETSSSSSCYDFIPLVECVEKTKLETFATETNERRKDDDRTRSKTEDYNRRLFVDPHDVDLWLEFIEFQTHVFHEKWRLEHGGESVERRTIVDEETLVQIKRSIVEKALEKNPASKRLISKRLELIRDSSSGDSEEKLLSQEWKKFVFNFANDARVWSRYLRFVQCAFDGFTVSQAVGVYGKCLSTLHAIHDGTMTSHAEMPNTVEHMIAIFEQLCVFLHQSGHSERAVALYQAQIEFNLFSPSALDGVDRSDKIDFLSAFWESSLPRFGESGASGWADWVNKKGIVSSDDTDHVFNRKDEDESAEEKVVEDEDVEWKIWVAVENTRSSRHWLPWRQKPGATEGDDDCEDPDRIVLLEDISKCLFYVGTNHQRFCVLSSFLGFLDYLSSAVDFDSSDELFPISTVLENVSQIYGPSDAKTIFPRCLSDSSPENVELFRSNVYRQSVGLFEGYRRTVVTLWFVDFKLKRFRRDDAARESKNASDKEMKKFFKSLLSDDRNNLAIYQRYAHFEFKNGNEKDARKVFNTAIKMSAGKARVADNSYDTCVTYLLYRTYATLELGVKDDDDVCYESKNTKETTKAEERHRRPLCILISLSDGSDLSFDEETFAPTRLLKSHRSYSQKLDVLLERFNSVSEEDVSDLLTYLPSVEDALVHWISCFAFYKYLTSGVEAAAVLYEKTISSLQTGYESSSSNEDHETSSSVTRYKRSVHEMCVEGYVRLLRHHLTNNIWHVDNLRLPLLSFLKQPARFRDSRFLLGAFVDLESGFGFARHFRRYFHESLSFARTPRPALFAILAERKRMKNLERHQTPEIRGMIETGMTHQLRCKFEIAVNHSSSRHCILIWRLYLFFEAEMKNDERVKAVFYRALQECPWAKSLYVDCIRYLPEMLQEVTDLLIEKELRLRTPLEELSLLMQSKTEKNSEIKL